MAISIMPGENNENEEELGGYNQGFCEQATIVWTFALKSLPNFTAFYYQGNYGGSDELWKRVRLAVTVF